jgi:hydrogenase maturation factor
MLSTSVKPGDARFVSETVGDEGARIIRCPREMNFDRATNDNNRGGEAPECR